MLEQEAIYIKTLITKYLNDNNCLNIGASDLSHSKKQPWIKENIHDSIESLGGRIISLDIKNAPGVDIVGDIADPRLIERLGKYDFSAVFCFNVLEHVNDRENFVRLLSDLVPKKSYLFVSVPKEYPYHPDPIDTLYRPSVECLIDSFKGLKFVEGVTVVQDTASSKLSYLSKFKVFFRLLLPFYQFNRWKGIISKVFWVRSNYSVTVAVFKKL